MVGQWWNILQVAKTTRTIVQKFPLLINQFTEIEFHIPIMHHLCSTEHQSCTKVLNYIPLSHIWFMVNHEVHWCKIDHFRFSWCIYAHRAWCDMMWHRCGVSCCLRGAGDCPTHLWVCLCDAEVCRSHRNMKCEDWRLGVYQAHQRPFFALHILYPHARQSSSHGYQCSKEGEGPPRCVLTLWKDWTLGKGLRMPLRHSLHGQWGDSEAAQG